jgi:hypothetical protein
MHDLSPIVPAPAADRPTLLEELRRLVGAGRTTPARFIQRAAAAPRRPRFRRRRLRLRLRLRLRR